MLPDCIRGVGTYNVHHKLVTKCSCHGTTKRSAPREKPAMKQSRNSPSVKPGIGGRVLKLLQSHYLRELH